MLGWTWMSLEPWFEATLSAKQCKCRDSISRTCPRTSYWQHTANLLESFSMGNMSCHICSILHCVSLSLSLSLYWLHGQQLAPKFFSHHSLETMRCPAAVGAGVLVIDDIPAAVLQDKSILTRWLTWNVSFCQWLTLRNILRQKPGVIWKFNFGIWLVSYSWDTVMY